MDKFFNRTKLFFLTPPKGSAYVAGAITDVPPDKAGQYVDNDLAVSIDYDHGIDIKHEDPIKQLGDIQADYRRARAELESLRARYNELDKKLKAARSELEKAPDDRRFHTVKEIRELEDEIEQLAGKVSEAYDLRISLQMKQLEARKLAIVWGFDQVAGKVEELHSKVKQLHAANEKVKEFYTDLNDQISFGLQVQLPWLRARHAEGIGYLAEQPADYLANLNRMKSGTVSQINGNVNDILLAHLPEEITERVHSETQQQAKERQQKEAHKKYIERAKAAQEKEEQYWTGG